MPTVINPQIATVQGAPMAAATIPKAETSHGTEATINQAERDIIRPRLVSVLWICSKVATEERKVV